jgi:hypothetical protein
MLNQLDGKSEYRIKLPIFISLEIAARRLLLPRTVRQSDGFYGRNWFVKAFSGSIILAISPRSAIHCA